MDHLGKPGHALRLHVTAVVITCLANLFAPIAMSALQADAIVMMIHKKCCLCHKDKDGIIEIIKEKYGNFCICFSSR